VISQAPHLAAMEQAFFSFLVPVPGIYDFGVIVIILGLALDGLAGDMPWLFSRISHPVVWIGRLISFFEKRLNRPERSDGDRLFRGAVTVLIVLAVAGFLGGLVQFWALQVPSGIVAEIFLLGVLIAQKGLYQHVAIVADTLEHDGLVAGRMAVSMIVGRDPASLDYAGVSRAAIESCSENFSDGVVAPLFWFVVAGPIGLCLYKATNTLDSMIGHRNRRYLYFGRFAARLDDVVNFIPARLAGALVCLAVLISLGFRAGNRAWRTMWRDARKHKSPNAGWQEAAMAGGLGLSLAGPRQYGREIVQDPYIGDGRRNASPDDIRAALRVFVLACVLNGLWPLLIWMALNRSVS
jgi:adenosylcobinamide-phosphate synthase